MTFVTYICNAQANSWHFWTCQNHVEIFFKHQILFQKWLDAILCIAYSIFCTHTTSVTTFCLSARVFTVYCLISIELPTVCSSREDGCSFLSRESIGKSCFRHYWPQKCTKYNQEGLKSGKIDTRCISKQVKNVCHHICRCMPEMLYGCRFHGILHKNNNIS